MPMNQLEMFKNELYISDFDNSSEIYKTAISIPSSAGITQEQMKEVVTKIKEFYKK
jgi:dTDP-4-amino-4,6-dideoxygalactose transaminase